MNALILSRWFAGSASPKERRSGITNDASRHLNTRFGPISEAQPDDRSPHNPVADKLSANQVRLAALMAVVLRP
jgi:hypothetical protein